MDGRIRVALVAGWAAFALNGTAAGQSALDFGGGSSLKIQQLSPWMLQVSGLVNHFKEPSCEHCSYRTGVPGIGLAREFAPAADSPLRFSLAGGLQSDSFGESGGYAAAVASLAYRGESFIIKPGIGGFAFYRYMERGPDQGAGRELVPAILPVLTVESARTGFGATLLLTPNFSYAGRDRSGFVFLQFTYRLGTEGSGFRIGTRGSPGTAVASDGDGRLQM